MKIALLGHRDIASLFALDNLVQRLPDHKYRVFWSGATRESKDGASRLAALAAADQRLFVEYLARGVTSPLFRDAQILDAPNSPEGLHALAQDAPDLIVSIRYRRILRNDAIAIPRHGVLNLHSGILPDYRGVMATFWAMLAGEREIGTTLHRIVDAGIDTGPVIATRRQPVDYSASYLDNVLSLYPAGCEMLAWAIDEIDTRGSVSAQNQPLGAGSYYGAPSEKAALRFLKKGLQLAPLDKQVR